MSQINNFKGDIPVFIGMPENKDPGLWRILEDSGHLRTQDSRGLRTLEDLFCFERKFIINSSRYVIL